MLQEALSYQFNQGVALESAKQASKNPVVVSGIPNDGSKVHIFFNGKIEEYQIPASRRSHQVAAVSDLIEAARKWNKSPVIWVDSDQVVLVIDDLERRDAVKLSLKQSATFNTIKSLTNGKQFGQPELVRLLRVDFRKAQGIAEILAAVRKIKFRVSAEGSSSITHGGESLGKQIENEVSGAGSIPEFIIVPANVFSNPGEESFVYEIGIDIEIDAVNQRFTLRPIPDEIERMTAAALHSIYERIKESLPDVSIFYGRP